MVLVQSDNDQPRTREFASLPEVLLSSNLQHPYDAGSSQGGAMDNDVEWRPSRNRLSAYD
jgi:hypothetical protein